MSRVDFGKFINDWIVLFSVSYRLWDRTGILATTERSKVAWPGRVAGPDRPEIFGRAWLKSGNGKGEVMLWPVGRSNLDR